MARKNCIDTNDLTGKTAVVTGAGSGIGRSIATLVGSKGARVHVVDRDFANASAVAGELRASGVDAVAHAVDVADAEAVGNLADAVFAEGPVDLLFNNAGIGHGGEVVDCTLDDWRRMMDVNFMGVVHGVHHFLPRMLEQGTPAHIVNTASMAGLVPNPGMAPYSASKAAVVGLTESLEGELKKTNVSVSALCPGVINTAIIGTSTMRGRWAEKGKNAKELYATKGTSPDVVAKHALNGVSRQRIIIPTPRHQVLPGWFLKRWFPKAGRWLTSFSLDQITKG